MKHIDTVVSIFSGNCLKVCKFLQLLAIPETSPITIRQSIESFSPKTELFSLFVISLVLSLNFSINDTRSSGSVAK